MRDFNRMTVIPWAGYISVDGEMYQCEDVVPVTVNGAMRTVPADRVLAIHWNGAQGHIEGFGAFETFTDRAVVERFLEHWLAARAKTKSDAAEALARKRRHETDYLTQNAEAVTYIENQVRDLEGADVLTHHEAAALHLARNNVDRLKIEREMVVRKATTERHIAQAETEAEKAKREKEEYQCHRQQ